MTSLEARVALLRTDPICRDLSFDNFTTVLLEFKTVFHMTGNLGRVRRNVVLMATGNKQVETLKSGHLACWDTGHPEHNDKLFPMNTLTTP